SPSLAQKIRQQLERQFGPGYERWVAELGATRRRVLASNLDPQRKRGLLQSLASREAFEAAVAEKVERDKEEFGRNKSNKDKDEDKSDENDLDETANGDRRVIA
ncbi:MAG: hypothetical protein WAK22_02765, partial [Candidatus Sulfotelmatobacter sp.]